jgi:hypothetical protein
MRGDEVACACVVAGLPIVGSSDSDVIVGTMDDYLLRALLDRRVFESTKGMVAGRAHAVSHEKAMEKVREFTRIIDANGLPKRNSKNVLHWLVSVTDYKSRLQHLARRVTRAALDVDGSFMEPLASDLHSANLVFDSRGQRSLGPLSAASQPNGSDAPAPTAGEPPAGETPN